MKIRPSRSADARVMSQIYVKTWRDTYLGVIPFGYLFDMSVQRHEQALRNELESDRSVGFIAEDAGRGVGFITGGSERNGDAVYGGEVYALYVLRSFQRQGVGTMLVSALADRMAGVGIHSMLVRVLEHNPYRRFYKKLNGTYLKREHQTVAGERLAVAVYGWLDISLIHG